MASSNQRAAHQHVDHCGQLLAAPICSGMRSIAFLDLETRLRPAYSSAQDMKQELRAIANRILRHHPSDYNLNPHKKAMIDFACEQLNMRSFADLGGVWNVDGGYTFYAMERHEIKEAVLVDTDMTPQVFKHQRKHPGLRVITGNFGDPAVRNQIGRVDGLFFYDILLHQVKPDWDEILRMYSDVARIFLILNQQFISFSKTTRLLDLGRDEYFRNVPHRPEEEPYKTYFQNLDAIHPQHKRPYRDSHNIWQWGVVDDDIITRMQELGFKMQFYKNCGQFGHLKQVENHGFVFSKVT